MLIWLGQLDISWTSSFLLDKAKVISADGVGVSGDQTSKGSVRGDQANRQEQLVGSQNSMGQLEGSQFSQGQLGWSGSQGGI